MDSPDEKLSAGRFYLVRTDSGSMHLIDLELRTITRFPSLSAPPNLAMRNDYAVCDLLAIHKCVVGAPLVVLIDLHLEPPQTTIRTTTRIASITRIGGTQ